MKSERISKIEVVFTVLIGLLVMFAIALGTGTLMSGYHFPDDHEHLRFENLLKAGESIWAILEEVMSYEMSWRFRPLWVIERVLLTGVFGSNMLVWNVYKAIMGGITLALFYLAARCLKCSRLWSGLFALLVIIGDHFTPWYREANQENTGLFIFAICFFLLAEQYYEGYKNRKKTDAILVTGIILCGLCKESFTLMMPMLIAFRIWLEFWREKGNVNVATILKRNVIFLLATIVPFFVNVYIIIFVVGTDKTGYAGFDAVTGIEVYIKGLKTSLFVYQKWYLLFGIVFVLISLMGRWVYKKKDISKYMFISAVALFVLGTQLVAHAKGVMYHRYTIPAIVGYMLPFVIGAYHCLKETTFRKKAYVLALIGLLMLESLYCVKGAIKWTVSGKETNAILSQVLEKTEEDSVILLAFGGSEEKKSSAIWLESHGREQGYIHYSGDMTGYDIYEADVYSMDTKSTIDLLENESIDAILCDVSNYEKVMAEIQLPAERYSEIDCGSYRLALKR